MFLHLSSSLQLASPPTSVVRTPASAVSARAVALCCFAGKLPPSLRAAKIFLHLSSSLCIAAAHDLLRSAANQTRIFDAQTLIPRRLRICITLQTMQATPAESCRTFGSVQKIASKQQQRCVPLLQSERISRASKAGKWCRNCSDSSAGQKIPPIFAAASR